MTLFTDAFDVAVGTDLGVDATYKVGGLGSGTAVRVLMLARDMTAELQGLGARVDRQRIQVAASAVAAPKTGDTLTIGSKVWKVAAPPEADARGVAWSLDCTPA